MLLKLLISKCYPDVTDQFSASLCDRLLDYDENVRKQVVSVICDVACHAPASIPVETIKLVAERLRDKSVCSYIFLISFHLMILFFNFFFITFT